jgi:hypothetical protein
MINREAAPNRRSKPAANIIRLRKGKALKARNTDDADCRRRRRHERGPHERRRR